jgi:hypothetical protein
MDEATEIRTKTQQRLVRVERILRALGKTDGDDHETT